MEKTFLVWLGYFSIIQLYYDWNLLKSFVFMKSPCINWIGSLKHGYYNFRLQPVTHVLLRYRQPSLIVDLLSASSLIHISKLVKNGVSHII